MRTIGVGVKIAVSLLALTSFSILLSNYSVYAEESSVSTATVTINQSCSMVGTTNTAHTATLANGTYSGTNYPNGIGQTTLKVFCNDSAGFAIYAIGYTGNEYGNTKLHNDTLGTANDISTGIYTSGNTINSTWSMKLASVSGTYAPTIADGTNNTENFTTWHTIPTEYTKVAYRTSTTDADNNGQGAGSSLTTTYDAYVSATQPAGTYIGQVKYTLVHPNTLDDSNKPPAPLQASDCPGGWVCYAPNSSEIIGSMDSLSSTKITSSPKAGKIKKSTSSTSFELIAPNYSRPGYGFAGWSTKWDAVSAYNNNETVYIYGPNETITTADLLANEDITFSSQGLILYPVWIVSTGNLQGTNGQGWTGCSTLTTAPADGSRATLASVTALTDTRDNNVYAVARLADGKCWMVENLRLNAEDSRGDANIAKAQGYGDATANNQGKFIGLADSENANFFASPTSTAATTANSIYYSGTQSGTATIDIFQTNYAGERMPRYNSNNTNRNLTASYNGTGSSTYYQWYSYGNYYSWSAAMANTESLNTYSGTNGSDAVGTSICPKGWKLPLGYTSTGTINGSLQDEANDSANRVGGFSYLDRKLGGTGANQSSSSGATQSKKWRSFPNNFVYAGHFYQSSAMNRNGGGPYWSSSARTEEFVYSLSLSSSAINPGFAYGNKYYGRPVRCIAQ